MVSRRELFVQCRDMIALRSGTGELIGYYEKHEYRNIETAAPYDFSKIKSV